MSNSVKVIVGVMFALAFVVGLIGFAIPHLWRSVGKAKVTFVDGSSGMAKVYKSKNGELMFSIDEQPHEIYLFVPATRLIGIPTGDQFVFLPMAAYSVDVPVPVVFSNNRVKVETDMNIVVAETNLQFTTLSGRRVEADLNDY